MSAYNSKLVQDARTILREVIDARDQLIRSQGGVGVRTPYGVCILPQGDDSFRIVTLNESIGFEPTKGEPRSGLTARMVRDLSRELVLVCGNAPATFLEPDGRADDELVKQLEFVLLVYPPVRTGRGGHYSFFQVRIEPSDLIVRPLVLTLRNRPPSWPP